MLKLLIIFSLFVSSFSQQTENNGTLGDTVNGDDLVKLGRQLQKPMLTIIGMALRNLHACEWTNWSPCSVRKQGYFGSRTRTRTCNYDKNDDNTNHDIENANELCEGKCPSDYNITKHGYCIKFYTERGHDDAVTQCRDDGGYLINIESQQKHEDLKEMLQGYNQYVNVGGRRINVSSPWIYEYGKQTEFLEFHPGQPTNTPTELCLCLDRLTRLLHDLPCNSKYPFLCEIV